MTLIAAAGFSKPYKFKRFKKDYEYPYWGYSMGTTDAMSFVPNKAVILYGFTVYASDQLQFEIKYKLYVDDKVVEENEMTLSDWEDKFYKRIYLQSFHMIPAGANLEITCQIAKSFTGSDTYISTYYGEQGNDWNDVPNDHMGLWTVQASPKSGSSSIGYGNFPEILYYI